LQQKVFPKRVFIPALPSNDPHEWNRCIAASPNLPKNDIADSKLLAVLAQAAFS
jgi:hypothetical protein